MLELIALFVLIQCTLLARYLVFGAFEPLLFAFAFLFPLTALVLFLSVKS